MILFTHSRITKHDWTWRRVLMHYFTRGVILCAIDYLIDFPGVLPKLVDVGVWDRSVPAGWGKTTEFHKGDEGVMTFRAFFQVFEVMTALGLTMIFSTAFLPLFFYAHKRFGVIANELAGLILFLAFFVISNVAIVTAQGDDLSDPTGDFPKFAVKVSNFGEFLQRVFLYPGLLLTSWESIVYPVIPWIGLTMLGMGFAFSFQNDSMRTHRLIQAWGVLFFFATVLIRAVGGEFGNYRGHARNEESVASSFMQFFISTKYPPDLAYATITMSAVFFLIAFFDHDAFAAVEDSQQARNGRDEQDVEQATTADGVDDHKWVICSSRARFRHPFWPLLVFGRTPMFFYLLHFWLISCLEALCRLPDPPTGEFPIQAVFFVWVIVLLIMYQACVRYMEFKSKTHPQSLWRLF